MNNDDKDAYVLYVQADCPSCGDEVFSGGVLITMLTWKNRPSFPIGMFEQLQFHCACGANFSTAEIELVDDDG